MKINEMFKKDIGRSIQGVVKIGQDSVEMITAELDEYVVTKELNRHFDKFFEGYRKGTQRRTDKMGVWISGFFGSGKSHFLKILSYLLGSGEYEHEGVRKNAIDFFDGKIADSRVMADIQLATDTNTDVILFNIDAEADSDSKANKDPIVKVFMKVFNKMQGFCGSMPWIADLERQMTKDGSYDGFRARFKEISGSEWEDVREDFYFEQDNIIQTLAESTRMSGESALAWYNKAEANYSLDINSFARRVREYVEAKEAQTGKKQFVVFLCDEVGQYIGSSTSLMLNLQNIVEGLGSECGGQAWVICTGQEDIDSITNVNRDAFSKIIGRFDTRLMLSSANVDEVIKKRLLAKTDAAADKLRLLYEEKSAVLKTLIAFTDDTPEKWKYDSAEEFIDVYPFIPYQFNLLQAVFNGIRTHGASGKHLSEGERSLLNAFQEAALQFADSDDGILIPFNAFYKTVETFLDHNVKKVILTAQESVERGGALQAFDVEILKVLFMVKYIPNVLPANFENITALMVREIDDDKVMLKRNLHESLHRLETQKLIVRNGDEYIFLTNEEQDINREISEIKINQTELTDKAGGEIFSILFGLNKKFRYGERHDFGFNTAIDDRPIGSQKEEIGIRVITPLHTIDSADDMAMRNLSLREGNVIAALLANTEFLHEMEQVMQIEAFVRRNTGRALTETMEDIRTTKQREGRQRAEHCRELITEALRKANLYVFGNRCEIREKPPINRVIDAFNTLIESIFSKLSYINTPFLSVENLREIFTNENNQITLDGLGETPPNNFALSDMIDAVERSYYKNLPVTMRNISEQFGKIPYGWKDLDIAGIILTLFKHQKVRFELNGENIAADDLNIVNYVTKREYFDRLTVKWRDIISLTLINNAKNIARQVFQKIDVPHDEDGLMYRIKEFAAAELSGKDDSIKDLLHEYKNARYPGENVLENGRKLFEQIERIKDVKGFYEYLNIEKDAFLDYEEDVSDVKKFFKTQRVIFDKSLKILDIYEGNRAYVLDAETVELVETVDKITRLQSPYSEIHKLPDLIDQFMKRFSKLLEEERKPIYASIETDRDVTLADLSRRSFKDKFADKISAEFGALLDRLSRANNIYEAIAMQTESDRMKQRFIQSFIDEEARIVAELAKSGDDALPIRRTKTVTVKSLFGGTNRISSEADIENLLEELRQKLKSQLEDDTTIQII